MFVTKFKSVKVMMLVTSALVGFGAIGLSWFTLAQGGSNSDVADATSAAPLPEQRAKPEPATPIVVRENACLQGMAMSPDGAVVATVGITYDGTNHDSTVKLWDARTGKLKQALDEEKDSHLGVAFSHDFLAIGVSGVNRVNGGKRLREVRLLDAKSLALKHEINENLIPRIHGVSALAFSPDGKRLAVAGTALTEISRESAPFLKLWDAEKQRLIEGHPDLGAVPAGIMVEQISATNGVNSDGLAFSPDGKLLATAWRDGNIRLYDGRTGEFRSLLDSQLGPDEGGCGPIAFSPDSKTLASKGRDRTLVLWDLAEAKPRHTLKGHKHGVEAVAFSTDGRWIATGGGAAKDYEVILWDAKSGDVKQTFPDLGEPVHAIVFSPDSKTLAVSGGWHVEEVKGLTYKSSGALRLFPLELTTAPPKPEKEQEKGGLTAWGKEVAGLQAGLGYPPGQKRAYRQGETVPLVIRVRNVGNEAVSFQYVRQYFIENPPTVTDSAGKPVPLEKVRAFGFHGFVDVTLAAGKEIEIYELKLELRPTLFRTGKFQIQYERALGNSSQAFLKPGVLDKLATGKLELEIKAEPPANKGIMPADPALFDRATRPTEAEKDGSTTEHSR
jgi:WD40 repeat protein